MMPGCEGEKLSVFDYNDYRKYLEDYYLGRKSLKPTYSHRLFARQAGLSSPSHLLMIIKGQRNLSIKTIEKIASGLKLNLKERNYFELLVLYNQTDDLHLKTKYFSQILDIKTNLKKLYQLDRERFNFLSKWYVVAIYVMVDVKGFSPDPIWIANKLGNKIRPGEALKALKTLETLGFVKFENGRCRQLQGAITVPDDTKSMAVFQYHQSMLQLADQALRKHRVESREVNGVTVPIPRHRIGEIKEKIRAFRKEINQFASSCEDQDEVYQLNIQFFSLTKSED